MTPKNLFELKNQKSQKKALEKISDKVDHFCDEQALTHWKVYLLMAITKAPKEKKSLRKALKNILNKPDYMEKKISAEVGATIR